MAQTITVVIGDKKIPYDEYQKGREVGSDDYMEMKSELCECTHCGESFMWEKQSVDHFTSYGICSSYCWDESQCRGDEL